MLVDFDYFFAQCEEGRNPLIRDKPVVVCVYSGRTEDSGAVSTANYVAREYGVKSGMPIFLAKKKLANVDAVFLPVDRDLYEEVSFNIMSVLKTYAYLFEQVGIDEAYLDVTERAHGSFEEARRLAEKMMDEVKSREKISISIGVGPNKLVAKIAADFKKPNGLTLVKPEQTQDFLAPLPVNRLLGVGKKTNEIMKSLGVKTIGDLVRFDVKKLTGVFGEKLGAYFHDAAFGLDDSPVKERGEAESISRISTLKEDTRDLTVIMNTIKAHCEDIYMSLGQKGLRFKTVSVVAVMKPLSIRSRSKTFESSLTHLEMLENVAEELFRRLIDETNLEIRRAGVKVSGFSKEPDQQKHLSDF